MLSGQPLAEFLDLPLLRGDEPPEAGYVAATQTPWPGGVAVYGSPETTGFTLKGLASAPATVGTTLDDLQEGPEGRFDYGARVRIAIEGGELSSQTALQVFAGGNVAAVKNADDEWEVLQFASAELIAPGVYLISQLLRGQGGTELAMRPAVVAGARFVLINAALARLDLTAAEIGCARLAHRAFDARHRRRIVSRGRAHICRSGLEALVARARARRSHQRRRGDHVDQAHAHGWRQLGGARGAVS